jgi:transposase-like protein
MITAGQYEDPTEACADAVSTPAAPRIDVARVFGVSGPTLARWMSTYRRNLESAPARPETFGTDLPLNPGR